MKIMQDALKRRKGMGLDITLLIGTPEDKQEDKKSDELAPEVKDASPGEQLMDGMGQKPEMNPTALTAAPDQGQDINLIKSILANHEASQGDDNMKTLDGKMAASMRSKLKK